MEFLYWVDEEDKVLGKITREKAHKDLLLHRTGLVILEESGKIWTVRRSENKETFPGLYDFPVTFHVSFGESYEEAVKRECLEEIGFIPSLEFLGKFIHKDPPEYQMVAVWLGKNKDHKPLKLTEASNPMLIKPAKVDEIVNQMTPWSKHAWNKFRMAVLEKVKTWPMNTWTM